MPNVHNINRLSDHDEEKSISAAVARAKQQLADGFFKRGALRR